MIVAALVGSSACCSRRRNKKCSQTSGFKAGSSLWVRQTCTDISSSSASQPPYSSVLSKLHGACIASIYIVPHISLHIAQTTLQRHITVWLHHHQGFLLLLDPSFPYCPSNIARSLVKLFLINTSEVCCQT